MASEASFNPNVRSPRYSTTRSVGFRGGQVNAQGNIAPDNYKETAGVQPKKATTETGGGQQPISQFSAQAPEAPSFGKSLALNVGGKVASDYLSKNVGGFVDNLFKPSAPSYNTGGISGSDASLDSWDESLMGGGNGGEVGGMDNFDTGDYGVEGDGGDGGYWRDSGDGSSTWEAGSGVSSSVDGGWGSYAPGVIQSVIGYADNGINSSTIGTNVGRAAGSVIGNAIFPGVGGAIGGWLGGMVGGGCFISEAVMAAGGQGDNAPELMALRDFRDNVMMATPEGQAMVREYYDVAPIVVDAISERPDGMDIFKGIKTQFIDPAVAAIQSGNQKAAIEIYAAMINYATAFAAEAMTDDEDDQYGVSALGDHAAMMTHDDMSGAGMTQAGAGATDWAPPGNADPLASAAPISPGVDAYGTPADAPPPGSPVPPQGMQANMPPGGMMPPPGGAPQPQPGMPPAGGMPPPQQQQNPLLKFQARRF